MTTRARGFTVLELMVIVAIMGILAALSVAYVRAEKRNATVGQAASELQMRVDQLQFQALSEQTDHVLVIVDVPGNDASQCGSFFSSTCVQVFDLLGPTPAWKLQSFDPTFPGANVASVADQAVLGTSLKFWLPGSAATLPPPFSAFAATFKTFDPDLTAVCSGSRKCVAFRFKGNGQVLAEPPDPTSPPSAAKSGHALVIGSDLSGTTGAADQRGVLVATPSGIVRTFTVP